MVSRPAVRRTACALPTGVRDAQVATQSTWQLCEAILDAILGKECHLLLGFILADGSRQLTLRHARELVYYSGISTMQTF
jgi:hypothetical protein